VKVKRTRRRWREPDLLSEQDREKLAQSLTRLLSKYGRRFVSATIRHVDLQEAASRADLQLGLQDDASSLRDEYIFPPTKQPKRGVGRPYNAEPLWDRIWLAEMLHEAAVRKRAEGSRKPMADAVRDLYEIAVDEKQQQQPGHFLRWEKSIKKRRLRGRRELQEAENHWAKFEKRRPRNWLIDP
jgi:hypothetical protein